jgi:hypothetical protein
MAAGRVPGAAVRITFKETKPLAGLAFNASDSESDWAAQMSTEPMHRQAAAARYLKRPGMEFKTATFFYFNPESEGLTKRIYRSAYARAIEGRTIVIQTKHTRGSNRQIVEGSPSEGVAC